MGWTCGTDARKKKHIQNFVEEASWQKTIWKAELKMGG
jgi:hypothetical protein